MTVTTPTPYEVACEFLRVIRLDDRYEGDEDTHASWLLDGGDVAWHEAFIPLDDSEDLMTGESVWLDVDWLAARGVTEADLATACPLFTRDRYLSVSRSVFLDGMEQTVTDDAGEFCRIVGIDRRDPEVSRALNRAGLGVESGEYGPLREAAHSTDEDYVISLFQADLPLDAIIQLCSLPPMPLEYAAAMVGAA